MSDETSKEQLYWHCASCGAHEPAQPEYAHGEWEKCIDCYGVARVMTLKEGAAIEQAVALGRLPMGARRQS